MLLLTTILFLSAAINNASDYDKVNLMNQWYLERAIANSLLKFDSQAENDYKTCLNLNPNNLDCYYQFGVFLGNRNRKYEACNNFRILYNKKPNYRAGQDSVKEIIDGFCN